VIALIVYTFIGAGIFHGLEDSHGSALSEVIQSNKSTPDNLQKAFITLHDKQFDRNNCVLLTVDELSNLLVEYEGILRHMPQLQLHLSRAWQPRNEYWKWFMFCVTVYTTIGKKLIDFLVYIYIIMLYTASGYDRFFFLQNFCFQAMAILCLSQAGEKLLALSILFLESHFFF